MKNSKCKYYISWALLILVVLVTGCSSKNTPPKKTTLLLDWWANPNHIPIYVGLEKGFFDKQGIHLSILNLQEPPDSLIYVLSNQVDVALYYLPHCFRAYAHSPHFKVIGKLMDAPLFTFVCRKDSDIQSINDFHGKSLGIFGDCISKAIIEKLSERKIQFKMFKTLQFDLTTILYTKTLDIISGVYWNIEPFQLASKGVEVKSFKWEDLGFPDYPELVFISNNSFLKENPSFGKKFRKALQESIAYCLKKPDQAFEVYLKQIPEKNKEKGWERDAWAATYSVLAKSQEFDLQALKEFHHWLDKCRILCREFPTEEILELKMPFD